MSQRAPPLLSVHPSRALVDEKFQVLVENLPPGCPVTVHSLHQSEDNDYWEAYGHYVSNQRGTVSVSEDLSFGGTYSGKESMGLLWSLRPVPGSRKGLRLRKMNVCAPMLVTISVYMGHEGFRDQRPLASTLTERWYMAPGVKRVVVKERGVRGTLFIPPGPGPFPGILDMWGGGGGLVEYRSALLASRGFASLALEYLSPEKVRSADLEFTYFETAFSIIQEHPLVLPDRVGLLGLSLGSLVSFYLAAESSTVKPTCIVAVSSNYSLSRTKTIPGFHDDLINYYDKVRVDENNHHIWKGIGMALFNEPTKVDVGKINCPMLLISGCDDQNWPAVETVEDISRTMRSVGKDRLLTRVDYPGAGHLIEPPYSPHFRATNFMLHTQNEKVILKWGGETKPHSDAQEDSWQKILCFLEQHLYCSPSVRAKM
ncbi:peroxisomal succinyl-coenzyme A thioesterase-like isoform X2 [Mugil cephalus]|nr:peroxisomal succinyl-coenzyme A thioesterase-like isoform X2 [Mugil cephalus]XP_047431804.1 peroxisomal succinyl-coenzyme A thioesterase-like isoform X2 [Mugil cephalus]